MYNHYYNCKKIKIIDKQIRFLNKKFLYFINWSKKFKKAKKIYNLFVSSRSRLLNSTPNYLILVLDNSYKYISYVACSLLLFLTMLLIENVKEFCDFIQVIKFLITRQDFSGY